MVVPIPSSIGYKAETKLDKFDEVSKMYRKARSTTAAVPMSIDCDKFAEFDEVSKISGDWQDVDKFCSGIINESDEGDPPSLHDETFDNGADGIAQMYRDKVVAENHQLREINRVLWKHLHSNQVMANESTLEASRTKLTLASLKVQVENLERQLATCQSMMKPLEQERDESIAKAEEAAGEVSELKAQLSEARDEIKEARLDKRRESRQVIMLQHKLRMSDKDLTRTKQCLKDKIRQNVCMEIEIESMHEDMQGEKSLAATSRSSQSLAGDRVVSMLEEMEDLRAQLRKEKEEMEKNHRAELERVRTETEGERDALIDETNRLESLLLKEMDSHKRKKKSRRSKVVGQQQEDIMSKAHRDPNEDSGRPLDNIVPLNNFKLEKNEESAVAA